jgi:hypothetical protein
MAMIRTMKGAKSNFQIKAISIKPSCKITVMLNWGNGHSQFKKKTTLNWRNDTYHNTDGDGNSINLVYHKRKKRYESNCDVNICYEGY